MRALTKKEIANMRNNSLNLKDLTGVNPVEAAVITNDIDESTGESVNKGYILLKDGRMFGTISPTAIISIRDLIGILEEEECSIEVVTRKSNAGRDFISLNFS